MYTCTINRTKVYKYAYMISNNKMSVLFRRYVYLLLLCVFKYMLTLVFVVEFCLLLSCLSLVYCVNVTCINLLFFWKILIKLVDKKVDIFSFSHWIVFHVHCHCNATIFYIHCITITVVWHSLRLLPHGLTRDLVEVILLLRIRL